MKKVIKQMELSKEDVNFIISYHGGSAELTRKLGLKYTSEERSRVVDNWKRYGRIPPGWRGNLERMDPTPFKELFLKKNGLIETEKNQDSNTTKEENQS